MNKHNYQLIIYKYKLKISRSKYQKINQVN